MSIFTGLNGYHFKKFMESFLAAAGYNYGATIAHCQTAAFTTKIAHYFIKVDKTGMVHPDKKSKIMQLYFHLLQTPASRDLASVL
ncbi:MAG TPA: hypothetical protein VEZ17_13845 [Chitinophagaceae bacterium]|nr:hypothetical protein [Chitinophagaceae bacterium]